MKYCYNFNRGYYTDYTNQKLFFLHDQIFFFKQNISKSLNQNLGIFYPLMDFHEVQKVNKHSNIKRNLKRQQQHESKTAVCMNEKLFWSY